MIPINIRQDTVFFRLILFHFFIDKNKANIAAQLARHAKLELKTSSANQNAQTIPAKTHVSGFRWLVAKLGLNCENSSISKLLRRTVIISVAFFLISAFGPLYNLTEGSYGQEGDSSGTYGDGGYIDFQGGDPNNVLADIMTEDGFLLKPALNSTAGDRSTANEIFAYQVEAGDTLSSLAQRFGIKKETIVMENDLWNTENLKAGMILKILPVDGVSHVVKKGDTIEKIAKAYNVKAEDIIRQNQLDKNEPLLADTALIVPGGKKEQEAPVKYGNSPSKAGGNAPSNPNLYAYTGKAHGRLIWPTLSSARVTQPFHPGHYALDIANRNRGPIFAAAAGKVVRASYGWNGGYGNVIIIDHGGGMQTLYGHNEKLYVTVGQYVEQGQTIGWMGNTGNVRGPTGIHCHFEVRINGVKYNPMNFF